VAPHSQENYVPGAGLREKLQDEKEKCAVFEKSVVFVRVSVYALPSIWAYLRYRVTSIAAGSASNTPSLIVVVAALWISTARQSTFHDSRRRAKWCV
jgi:hypothetical protein